MRHPLLAALVLGPAALFLMAKTGGTAVSPVPVPAQPVTAQTAQACDKTCAAEWMDANLRLNQLQQIGTNASAKQKPEGSVLTIIRMGGSEGAEALDFGHAPLAQQLDSGVRALSFDIVNDPQGGAFKRPAIANMAMVLHSDEHNSAMSRPGFKVIHVPDVDYRSSCPALTDCLKQVVAWSHAHPGHLPLVITLRPNDSKTPMPGASQPPAMDAAALDALETEIAAIFAQDDLLTPAMVQGSDGLTRWPLLGEARGKVMLVLHGAGANAYDGALMFPVREGGAVRAFDDPVKDKARIAAAVRSGAMVLTHADLETREARKGDTARRDAAFASGAQVILTDFPAADPAIGPYRVSLKDVGRARCGDMLGSETCIAIRQDETIRTAGLP